MIRIYTDGSCRPSNPGPGGFSIIAIFEDGSVSSHAEAYHKTTNNRMELMAVIRAIQMYAPQHPLAIYTDSLYVANPVISGSIHRRDWDYIKQNPNPDLWMELQGLLRLYGNVKLIWVKGHSGNRYNEMADELCTWANTGNMKRKKDEGYKKKFTAL